MELGVQRGINSAKNYYLTAQDKINLVLSQDNGSLENRLETISSQFNN